MGGALGTGAGFVAAHPGESLVVSTAVAVPLLVRAYKARWVWQGQTDGLMVHHCVQCMDLSNVVPAFGSMVSIHCMKYGMRG